MTDQKLIVYFRAKPYEEHVVDDFFKEKGIPHRMGGYGTTPKGGLGFRVRFKTEDDVSRARGLWALIRGQFSEGT